LLALSRVCRMSPLAPSPLATLSLHDALPILEVNGRRAYLLQTAEKGIAWLRLIADGTAGHGSQINTDNAVTRLAEAVGRIGRHSWPMSLSPTVRALLDGDAELTGTGYDPEARTY